MANNMDPRQQGAPTAARDLGTIQVGWTVYDALDRPVGNVTDLEGGRLGVDGRPEGLGHYDVPTTSIRAVREGSVQLSMELEELRSRLGRGEGRSMVEETATTDEWARPGDRHPSAEIPVAAPEEASSAGTWAATRRESAHLDGSSYTASGTPVGLGSNTPVGDEPRGYQAWDEQVEEGSKVGRYAAVLGPVAIGAASAGGYLWWRKRQARRNRLRRIASMLTSAGSSLAPVMVAAARDRKRLGWLAPLVALPLAYYLRPSGDRSTAEQLTSPLSDVDWKWRAAAELLRDRLPTFDADRFSRDDTPPAWTLAVPVVGAGLVAAWLAARQGARRSRQLGDIMTRNVRVIRPDATIFEAASLMRSLNVGSLPVCDGNRLRGMITDRDVVLRTVAESRDPQVATVEQAMTHDVVYAYADDSVDRGAQLMRQHQIRRLPIVDRQHSLVGIVALGDLAVDTGRDRLSGDTLERISEPARPAY